LSDPAPRLPGLDLPWAQRVERFCLQASEELAREMKDTGQAEHVLLATYQKDLGLVRYALGHPLSEVRWSLHLTARALHRVFELRGTTPAFEAMVIEPSGEPNVHDARPLHPPGTADASLTNSRRGREALLLALAAGDDQLARAIAPQVWDPEGASYLGPGSVVTTTDDQALAYAWRDLLLGKDLPPIALSSEALQGALLEAAALESLAGRDAPSFLKSLYRLVEWHAEQAVQEEHRHQPDWLLCLPGLALAALAVGRGLVQKEELPGDSPYLPVGLGEAEE
jgi:hypothetical protein